MLRFFLWFAMSWVGWLGTVLRIVGNLSRWTNSWNRKYLYHYALAWNIDDVWKAHLQWLGPLINIQGYLYIDEEALALKISYSKLRAKVELKREGTGKNCGPDWLYSI